MVVVSCFGVEFLCFIHLRYVFIYLLKFGNLLGKGCSFDLRYVFLRTSSLLSI